MKPTTDQNQEINTTATASTPAKSDSVWIAFDMARRVTNRSVEEVRGWMNSGELASREENGVCKVLAAQLVALDKIKPRPLANKSKRSRKPRINNDAQVTKAVCTTPTGRLRPHPLSAAIYGCQHDPRLLESIKEKGVLSPLLVTPDGLVVSGGERLWAAQQADLAEVPVRIVPTTDETEIKLLVLEANVARDKTNEQRIREYNVCKEIEAAKAQTRQGTRNDLVQNFTPSVGKARDLAAAKVGWSGPTAQKGSRVLDAIEAHSAERQTAEGVRRVLNETSVDAAYKQIAALGWLDSASPKRSKEPGGYEYALATSTGPRHTPCPWKPTSASSPVRRSKLYSPAVPSDRWEKWRSEKPPKNQTARKPRRRASYRRKVAPPS